MPYHWALQIVRSLDGQLCVAIGSLLLEGINMGTSKLTYFGALAVIDVSAQEAASSSPGLQDALSAAG